MSEAFEAAGRKREAADALGKAYELGRSTLEAQERKDLEERLRKLQ